MRKNGENLRALFLLNAFKPNALIALERHSVVMLITDNLPGDTLREGITCFPFLSISVQVLAFCTLWYYDHQIYL
jgi:hypothetical protein